MHPLLCITDVLHDGRPAHTRFLEKSVVIASADKAPAEGSIGAQLLVKGKLVVRKGKTTVPFAIQSPIEIPSSYASRKANIEYSVVAYVCGHPSTSPSGRGAPRR